MSIQGTRGADDGPSQSNVQEGPSSETNTITQNKAYMKEIKDCIDQVYSELKEKQCSTDFFNSIKERYEELEGGGEDKVVVGLFGKTGAGKSSLLNAVLGIPKLLPSGGISACTSIITKVMANTSPKFEAEVEFISEEEWKMELERILEVIQDKQSNQQMVSMARSEICALYGTDASGKNIHELLEMQTFNNFLSSGKEIILSQSASDFSSSILCYIRSESTAAEWTCSYWPIVKSVTIKVPNAPDFMEHIVLVDLPGSGDWNNTRSNLWQLYKNKCSAVWIVTELNRCGSEEEAWNMLNYTLVNEGQCHTIAFICTKTDITSESDWEDEELDAAEQDLSTPQKIKNSKERKFILRRNENAKTKINEEITNWDHINLRNTMEISVHTVSSEEFKRQKILTEKETEIPDLRKILGKLNDPQSEKLTQTYVNNAYGMLSRINMTKCEMTETFEKEKMKLKDELTQRLKKELIVITTYMLSTYTTFGQLLSEAVKECKKSWDHFLNDIIKPQKDNRGYHQTLRAICNGNGYWRTKQGEIHDINYALARLMYEAIDNQFTENFPNSESTKQSVYGKVDAFNITSQSQISEDHNLFQHLELIKTEQFQIKEKVKDDIRQKKMGIYTSLKESVRNTMWPAYQAAAQETGIGSMKRRQEALEDHLKSSKDTMFNDAQEEMLYRLYKLTNHIHNELESKLQRAIEEALQTPANVTLPDVTEELAKIKKIKDQLIASTDESV